jgi:hypothetical protein
MENNCRIFVETESLFRLLQMLANDSYLQLDESYTHLQ